MATVKVVVLKQNIFNSPKFAYCYDAFVKKYPFVNINDTRFFKILEFDLLKESTKVLYNNEIYFTTGYYSLHCYGNFENPKIEITYKIAKDGIHKLVNSNDLVLYNVDNYYYLTDTGKVAFAKANNIYVDEFRHKTNNFFITKEDALNALHNILTQK